MSKRELPRADMTIESAHDSVEEEDIPNEDVEGETYIPSPRTPPTHGKGKGNAGASDSGAARDEIEEESDGNEEEEVFDVEDILPPSYVGMGALVFRVPQNPR
jgi:hypothetical protein